MSRHLSLLLLASLIVLEVDMITSIMIPTVSCLYGRCLMVSPSSLRWAQISGESMIKRTNRIQEIKRKELPWTRLKRGSVEEVITVRVLRKSILKLIISVPHVRYIHGEVARIPYHDHNSTTAETELKYLRTYGSIFTFLDTNKFSFTLVSSSSSLSTLVSHNLKRGQTSKKTKYFRPCTETFSNFHATPEM